jgi:hypothetical protein
MAYGNRPAATIRQLRCAEIRVQAGETLINENVRIIHELKLQRAPTEQAEHALDILIKLHASHIVHHDLLKQQLEK